MNSAKIFCSVVFLALFAVTQAMAQFPQPPYERVLVPVIIADPLAGAYGSQWITDLVVRNESDEQVTITPIVTNGCVASCQLTPAHTLYRPSLVVANPNAGTFLYIGKPGIGKVTLGLRVQDTSRQLSTWGTSVPVVREKDIYTGKLQLLNIPVNADFRAALRVYDFDTTGSDTQLVRVRIFDMCGIGRFDNTVPFPCTPATPLVDTTISLVPAGPNGSSSMPAYPATAMIGDLVSNFPQLAALPPRPGEDTGIPRVRIDIDPITPGLRFWAFISVTHNATQHVTVITPN